MPTSPMNSRCSRLAGRPTDEPVEPSSHETRRLETMGLLPLRRSAPSGQSLLGAPYNPSTVSVAPPLIPVRPCGDRHASSLSSATNVRTTFTTCPWYRPVATRPTDV